MRFGGVFRIKHSYILREIGVGSRRFELARLVAWAVDVPNIVGGVLALVFTDKLGRRPLLLWSFGGMSACLVALSAVDIYTLAGYRSSPKTTAVSEAQARP